MLQIILLYALVKLVDIDQRPWLAALIYAIGAGLIKLLFTEPEQAISTALISLVIGFIFFWLLHYLRDSYFYWLVLVLGLLVFFI